MVLGLGLVLGILILGLGLGLDFGFWVGLTLLGGGWLGGLVDLFGRAIRALLRRMCFE